MVYLEKIPDRKIQFYQGFFLFLETYSQNKILPICLLLKSIKT
jgi:hypothetical protein